MAAGSDDRVTEFEVFNDPIVYDSQRIGSLDELKRGDHIRRPVEGTGAGKGGKHHHMLVEGPGSGPDSVRVSHNTNHRDGVQTGQEVRLDPKEVEVLRYKHLPSGVTMRSPDEAIKRAHSDKADYSLLTNNCEHYVNRAKIGKSRSPQVEEKIRAVSYEDEPSFGAAAERLTRSFMDWWGGK